MTIDDDLAAARLILDRMGIRPEDLLAQARRGPRPTLTQLIETVFAIVPAPTRRTYAPYWRKASKAWPDRSIDNLTPGDVAWFIENARTTARVDRAHRGGHSAAEHAYDCLRCLYRHAVNERLIHPLDDPTIHVSKPKRHRSTRRALETGLVESIAEVAATTGNDPALDGLLIRFHIETAARRGGALNLRNRDLDPDSCLIQLREKGTRSRWQPVSPTLMHALQAHAHHRGARNPDSPTLRYHTGSPLTARRYDHLWHRIGQHLPTVCTQGITSHWLRHTTLTWVERNHGYAVARAYAGHATATTNRFGVTATYVKADLLDVVIALSALTAEPHPILERDTTTDTNRTPAAASRLLARYEQATSEQGSAAI